MPVFEQQYIALTGRSSGVEVALPASAVMQAQGPIVHVVLSVHPAFTSEYHVEPILGEALIDTGCAMTAVDEIVLAKMQLPQVGTRKMAHADGETYRPCYPLAIAFPDFYAQPIPFPKATSVRLHASNQRIIALLGRDFLSLIRLTYNGPRGRFEIAL